MTKEEIKKGVNVRNIKHGVIETIVDVCKMRLPDNSWTDGVVYTGKDRFTGVDMIFVRELNSFLADFELA